MSSPRPLYTPTVRISHTHSHTKLAATSSPHKSIMAVVDIKTKDEFDSLVKSTPYVALQAHAPWCGPCKTIAPFFTRHAASQSVPQKYTFARFDTDEVPDLAYELNIRSIPAFYFFEKGDRASKLDVAGTSPPALKKSVDECYAKAQAKPSTARDSVCFPKNNLV